MGERRCGRDRGAVRQLMPRHHAGERRGRRLFQQPRARESEVQGMTHKRVGRSTR